MSHSHSHEHGDHDHSHGHSHGAGGHSHDDETESALQTLLWRQIEFEKIRTLNESSVNAGAQVVEKTWPQRLNEEPVLVSDTDEQLLMMVPFTGSVKLHSILVRSSTDGSAPKTLKIYQNRNDLDFSSTSTSRPTQTLILSQTSEIQDVPVKRALFNNTYCLTLFFEDNFSGGDEDETRIWYLGFKGEHKELNREPVEFLYEKAANPRDHTPIVGVGNMGVAQGPGHGM